MRSGDSIRAVLIGLSQEATRAEVARAAARHGVVAEERGSISEFVPRTVALRATDPDVIGAVARAAGAEVRWLTLDFLQAAEPRGIRQPAPVGYEEGEPWPNWSLAFDGSVAGVKVTKWSRPDRPSYWRVVADDLDVWSYHPNHARLWACSAIGVSPFDIIGDRELRVRHAFLPLPLARIVAAFGSVLPGPDGGLGGAYRYLFVSQSLRSVVLDALRSSFESRLNARSLEGITCSIR